MLSSAVIISVESLSENGGIEAICQAYGKEREHLIPVLQAVQAEHGYLDMDAIDRIADYFGISANEVYGVATFYAQFRYHPPGRHCLKICQGTACHVRGSGVLVETAEQALGIKVGQTTADLAFGLEELACLGSCALAPAVVVDGVVQARLTPRKLQKIIEKVQS